VIDENVIMSSRKASPSTNKNTSGARLSNLAVKSWLPAATPATA
jgi:hypothetical protein